jgi:hypothetical protein
MPRDKIEELKALRRRFRELSPEGRLAVSALAAIVLGLIITAQRDLQLRPAAQIRGSKLLWRVVCLNAFGALVYLRWGRRTG